MNWPNGQQRRAWLDEQDAKLRNALSYYLGPAAAPVNALAGLAGMLSPGADMMDAAQSGQDLMRSQGPMEAAQNAGWLGASMLGAALPGTARGGKEVADEILRLLREGRGAEVTDKMMAAADQRHLFDNYDLPMDEASRMKRAGEMGFDTETPLYHGTGSDFQAFSPLHRGTVADAFSARRADWMTDSPRTAEGYADMASRDAPVAKLIKASEKAERQGDYDGAARIMAQAERLEQNMPREAGQNILQLMSRRPGIVIDADGGGVNELETSMRDALAQAKADGGIGVEFRNFSDHPDYSVDDPALHRGIFKPENIRSRFARFDPRLAHLRNLSASALAGYMGLNALSAAQDEQ